MRIIILFVLLVLSFSAWAGNACGCDHVLTPEKNYVNGENMNIQPGDVICLQAGNYKYLNLFNFSGTKEQPITFRNCGGQVFVGGNQHYYGVVLNNVNYFRFTGTGDPGFKYGIKVDGITQSGSGVAGAGTDAEIDHIEISNTGFAGILYKRDPGCDANSWSQNFVMRNVKIHDNYIHDTHGEGIYLGYTGGSKTLSCNGEQVTATPHDLQGVRVYNNRIEDTGWDGMQVSRAVSDCQIYNNTIKNFGMANEQYQKSGIVIGGGTTGGLYNNWIENGPGGGIHVFGTGDNYIYNNIIKDVGEDGIFCDDRATVAGRGFYFVNNTILSPKGAGMKMFSDESTGNVFYNNIVANPGGTFVVKLNNHVELYQANNLLLSDATKVGFEDFASSKFNLQENSSAVNKGKDVSGFGVHVDFGGKARPQGGSYDIGAFEYSVIAIPPFHLDWYPEQDGITLSWQDNSENEVSFVVEKSSNSSFSKDVTISYLLDKNQTIYKDTLAEEGKKYFYRVKAMHSENDFAYSNEVEAALEIINNVKNFGSGNNSLKVYPNPVMDFLWVDGGDIAEDFTIIIYHHSGKNVKEYIFAGKNEVKVNVEMLSKGFYVVKLLSKKGSFLAKFIKL